MTQSKTRRYLCAVTADGPFAPLRTTEVDELFPDVIGRHLGRAIVGDRK